jgi:hypothetical protein
MFTVVTQSGPSNFEFDANFNNFIVAGAIFVNSGALSRDDPA